MSEHCQQHVLKLHENQHTHTLTHFYAHKWKPMESTKNMEPIKTIEDQLQSTKTNNARENAKKPMLINTIQ